MTEHKFTGEEVMKALECCRDFGDCSLCPYDGAIFDGEIDCAEKLHTYALDLINRQKAEIAYWMDAAVNAKKEAVKEFAERLKKYYGNLNSNTAAGLVEYHIDQIKEEMLCEK